MNFLYLYLISVPVFVVIDLIWLGLIAKNFYQEKLGYLLGEVNWLAAIIFYLLFLLGMTFFVTAPAVAEGDLLKTFLIGAFFGVITYATYDLTNQATIKDWPVIVTVVDIIWGGVLGGLVASVTLFIYKLFI